MPNLELYTRPTKLVLAFDIGATYSSISYCIHEPGRVPDILRVTTLPARRLVHNDSQIPSLLYYDKAGNVRAAGAEVFTESIIKVALIEGWIKAERWEPRLHPEWLASSVDLNDDLPPLPPGKSAVDILTDFIKYLAQCAKNYIQGHHLTLCWSSIEDSVEYVFTHPNGWEDVRHQLYRQAIERVGLTPSVPGGRCRIHVLTEGEAILHFCIPDLLNTESANQAVPRRVVVINTGDWTINLSMFSMTFSPISCEEIAPAECRLQGSILVSRRAKALLRRKLDGWERSSDEDIIRYMREFDQTTKLTTKNDQEPAYIKVAGFRYNNSKYNISRGNLKLTGEEVTGLFNDSIDAIIDAFEQQQKSTTMPITTALLVGCFSTNEWLWFRLQSYFKAKKIDTLRSGSPMDPILDGAILSHIKIRDTHPVAPQVSSDKCDKIKWCMWRKVDKVEKTVESTYVQEENSSSKITLLEKTAAELHAKLTDGADEVDRLKKTIESLHAIIHAFEQKHQCEVLFSQGRITDAAKFLLQITTTVSDAVRANKTISSWLTEFTNRCVSTLEKTGDEELNVEKHDEAIEAYSNALSLTHSVSNTVLTKWAGSILIRGSANEALRAASKFKVPRFDILRAICDTLEGDGRVMEATACFQQMENELAGDMGLRDQQAQWTLEFQRRCTKRLEKLGDAAVNSGS